MAWDLNSSITIVWVSVVVALLILYGMIFRFFYGPLSSAFKRSVDDPNPQLQGETFSPTEKPIELGDVPLSYSKSEATAPSYDKSSDCRFSDPTMQEFSYNDVIDQVFYLLGFDDNHIRTATITSTVAHKQVDLACSIGAIENGRVPHQLIGSFQAVPIQFMTHLTYRAFSSNPPFLTRLWHNVKYVLSKVYGNLILIPTSLIFAALILCFYVPTYMDDSQLNDEGAEKGYNATLTILILTVLTVFFHLILMVCMFRDSHANNLAKILQVVALFWLVIALCLAIYICSLAVKDYKNGITVNGGDNDGWWDKYTCQCPPDPSTGGGGGGGSSNSSYEYAFVCSLESLESADYQTCDMNCGVCGSTYRDPFISYTQFAMIYAFIILFLVFVHFLIGYMHAFPTMPYYLPVQTGMELTLHGSRAFGFPILTRLSVADTVRAERQLNALRKAVETDDTRRSKEFLAHIAATSSSETMASQSVASDIKTSLGKIPELVFGVLRMFGLG